MFIFFVFFVFCWSITCCWLVASNMPFPEDRFLASFFIFPMALAFFTKVAFSFSADVNSTYILLGAALLPLVFTTGFGMWANWNYFFEQYRSYEEEPPLHQSQVRDTVDGQWISGSLHEVVDELRRRYPEENQE